MLFYHRPVPFKEFITSLRKLHINANSSFAN